MQQRWSSDQASSTSTIRADEPEPKYDEEKLLQKLAHRQAQQAKRRRRTIIIILLVLLMLASAATVGLMHSHRNRSPFPPSLKQASNFSLLYPSENKLDPRSIQTAGNIVSYTVNYKDSRLYVTLQPLPKNFDFAGFEKQIEQPKAIRTSLGKAILGVLSDHQIGSLRTSDCWALITGTKDTPQSDIETILHQFKKA